MHKEPEEIVLEEPPVEVEEEPEPEAPPQGTGQLLGCISQGLILLALKILGIMRFCLASHSSSLILKHKF